MHPRFLARTAAVERAKRISIYRALDDLLDAVAELCRRSGLNAEQPLREQRELLARIAAADPLTTGSLLDLAAKLVADAKALMAVLHGDFAAVTPDPLSPSCLFAAGEPPNASALNGAEL